MPHTADTTTGALLVVLLLLGLTGCAPPSPGSSPRTPRETTATPGAEERRADGDGRGPAESPDGPAAQQPETGQPATGQDEQVSAVLAVPGGFATTGWMESAEHVGHVLRLSPDGEHWDWIPLPVRHDARPTLRLAGPDLIVSTDPSGVPAWTVEDVESLVPSVTPTPSPSRVGAGFAPWPV